MDFGLTLQELAKPGSFVKKGDVVAAFDRENMMIRLDDYRASVAQGENDLQRLKAQLEVSKKSHDQSIAVAKAALEKARLDLKTEPIKSAIDAERLRLAVEEAEAQYKQYLNEVKYFEISQASDLRRAELDQAGDRVELKRSEANADKMIIRAPLDGLVVMQSIRRSGEMGQIQQGDQLSPGFPFMQIVDTSSMIVNATVNQADVESIRVGSAARVRFDAYPDLELPAVVHSIGAMTQTGGFRASYVKAIPVVLKLTKTDPRVIPDLSVSVDVITASEKQVVMAPLESIFRDAPSGQPYVFLRSPTGWERKEVELGLANNVAVVVRSGVRAGDVLAAERPQVQEEKKTRT